MTVSSRDLNGQPTVSIGITCFNAVETIARAVRCALDQDWPRKEIIVVDDGSTDGSLEVLSRIAAEHHDVSIIVHDQNTGFPAALNTILAHATGEFVAFFDDDDVSRSDRLRLQVDRITHFERQSDCRHVICYTNRIAVPYVKGEQPVHVPAIGRTAPEPYGLAVRDFLFFLVETPPFTWGQFGSCTMMARRSTFVELGGFDESFRRAAEWDFAIRATFIGARYIAVDQPLLTQFITAGADKSGRIPLVYALRLRKKYFRYLRDNGGYWAAVMQAHARFHYAKGNRLRHRMYTLLSCLLAPTKMLPHVWRAQIRKRHENG
jgi:glycosyltransferase involved in cell wall biosynthesis